MKILLDNNIPNQLRRHFFPNLVFAARSLGWDRIPDGDLIRAGESNQFDVLVTADKKLFHQQNDATPKIALVVIGGTKKRAVLKVADSIVAAVNSSTPGSFAYIALDTEQE
jgi:hypothetical protein